MTPRTSLARGALALSFLMVGQPAHAFSAVGAATTSSRVAAIAGDTPNQGSSRADNGRAHIGPTFDLPKDLTTRSGGGIEATAAETGRAIEKSIEAAAHYSESGGKILVHLLEHARLAPVLPLDDPWR
jgi:hypothetical protein